MHHLISHFILEKYGSGQHTGSLPAASVFVDVSGFSKLTEALARRGERGAEILAEVMRSLFAPLVEAVHEQGGYIIGYAGDAFTAVFVESAGRAPSVKRALAATVRMQEQILTNPLIRTEFGSFPITIKAGLGFGEASWLIIKDSGGSRATYCVRGSSVDGAVSAEGVAEEGEIVVDEASLRLLGQAVHAVPAGSGFLVDAIAEELPQPQPFEIPDPQWEMLADFYPRELIEQELTGEFRPVVNIFIDIPIDPKEEAFVTPFMESIFALQRRYGGFFLRPDMGDKGFNILMFWGAPTAHENDVDRALSFLLDLREYTRINFRAGITYRLAYAGFIGADSREDYTAYGWGVNLASRMMEAAGPGEFWLDGEIERRASRRFQIESLGKVSYKGFSSGISTYKLQKRKRLVDLAFHGDLVGREAEMQRLDHFMEPFVRGELAGMMLIRGEAGIGKSHLVYSLQESMQDDPVPAEWVICQTDEMLQEPFDPFRHWLMSRFGITEEQDDEVNLKAFEAGLLSLVDFTDDSGLAAELMRTASVLAAVMNIEQSDSLYARLDAKGRRDNTLIGFSAVLRALAARGPLVILIEDLQWLDEESRDLLEYFARTLQIDAQKNDPVAILVTSRPGADWPVMQELLPVEIMDLGRLSASSLAPLARSVLGAEADPDMVQLLEQRSDGNPFFAEQILHYLVENDLLERRSDGSMTARAASRDSIPSDVRAVLIARLDRLSSEVREIVQTASVLGREFEVRLLAAMLHGDHKLPQKVVAAEKANIWIALNELEYIFRHALVRDAAYGMQLLTRQRALHALALRSMEELYKGDLSPHLGELAYHAERAKYSWRAFHYLSKAARVAADAYQNAQGIDYLTRALALSPGEDPATRFDLIESRVELQARLGNRSAQLADLEELEKLAVQLDDEGRFARLWTLRSHYHFVLAQYTEAIQYAERAISRTGENSMQDAPLMAYNTWAIALLRLSELKTAMRVAKDGLELARSCGNRYYEGLSLNSMGMIAYQEENAEDAERYLGEAEAVADQTDDTSLKIRVLTNLGNLAGFLRGDYASARRRYEHVFSILQARGDRYALSLVLPNLGWAAGMLGDFKASRSHHSQAVEIAREVGNLHGEAYALINLSAVASIQGDTDVALEAANRALEITKKTGDRVGESWAMLNQGHAYLAAGELDQARQSYLACIKLRMELDRPGFEMEPVAGLIQVALKRGALPEALESTERILGHLEGGGGLGGAEEPLRIYAACYEVLRRLDDPRAGRVLAEAGKLLEAQLSGLPDETARQQFIDSVPWRGAIQRARDEAQ